ncbi:MAG TPA: alpha/beta hydrolase [Candidatus Binataceae bacterium]|nr:alpha/beta hydrolase [Candidatus Binataceae bacterium]
MADIIGPTSHFFYSQRLKLHYVDWGNHNKPLAVLVHGGRDHSRNWDFVALDLRNYFHIIAPDLRGHGDSDWSIGGSYSITDHVLDLGQLLNALPQQPAVLIGHSLGAGVALQRAGVFPEAVKAVIAIEGLGPPGAMLRETPAHERMEHWVSDMLALAQRKPREYSSIEQAMARMKEANPHLSADLAHHLTIYGVRRNENGTFSWKYDNYTRATSPYLFNLKDAMEIWSRVRAPTLLVRGDASWAGDWERDGRLEAFRAAELVTIPGAGHWVHHDRLAEFLQVVHRFLKI